MNKKQAKQKLFEIIEKYQNGTITEDDVKILTEIIVTNNPYSTSRYDITVDFEKLLGEEANSAAIYSDKENRIIVNTNYLQKLLLSPNAKNDISLIGYLNTIFHELRHCDQFKNPDVIKQELDSEEFEKVLTSLKIKYAEEQEYSKDFVNKFVELFQEGFHGEFLKDFTDEENIADIVNEITDSFYLRDACEYDARQSAIKISRGFIYDIFNDSDSPDIVKDWCTQDRKHLDKIEENEILDNKISNRFNSEFHNLPIEPKYIKEIIKKIGKKTSELETAVEKTKTQEAIDERDNFEITCRRCVRHLFKDKTIDELVNFYIVAMVNPNFYIINIEEGNVSLSDLNNDIVIKSLQIKILEKLQKCSPEKQTEISKKILKVAKLPVAMAGLLSSNLSLNILSKEDKKILFVKSICSYINSPFMRASNANCNEIMNSFDPTNPQDCKHIESILNFYNQNINASFDENTKEEKLIKLKKITLLQRISKRLNLVQLMEKFGKAQEFEEIIKQTPQLSIAEQFKLKKELDQTDSIKIDSAIYGKTYAKILQAKEKVIKISEYDTNKNFIENSENTPMSL